MTATPEAGRFRMTVWPGAPVTVPTVALGFNVEPIAGDFLHYERRTPRRTIELPDEFVLRELFEVDASDATALAQFTETWGPLAALGDNPFQWLPPLGPPDDQLYAELTLMGQAVAEREQLRPGTVVHVSAVSIHARMMRALARQATAWLNGEEHDAALRAAWTAEGFTDPDGQEWIRWTEALNGALRPFAVHVSTSAWSGDWTPNAYTGAALQLANLLAEGTPVQRCASETCGRLFVRQRGRAQFAQHRTRGVLYCSAGCAQAQKSREYRRRKQQEKER